jgi:exodeoxyribonuclease VII large subunit
VHFDAFQHFPYLAPSMEEINYIKLSDLTKRIRQVINETFGEQTYWIVAELSGHKFYPDRDRHYFDLVEKIENSNTETAKVKANSWEQGSRQISLFENITGQTFGDGLQILACVKVNYHIVYGLSMTLIDVDPNFTLGNVERQRRETLQRLLAENADCIELVDDQYITRNKKLKLNSVLQRIALIGSPKSEGYTDFLHTITNNQFGYKFTVDFYYSTVQGIGAEQELFKTFLQVHESNKTTPYDCVVITRGGGARTDFLVFDTYLLAKVAARFPIPIITGLGHHKDVSIVDLMVNTQTKTPTKAAEFILAHNRNFEENMLRYQQRIIIRTQQLLSGQTSKINQARHILSNVLPEFINDRKDQLNRLKQVIQHKPVAMVSSKKHDLLSLQQAVINCSSEILRKHDRLLATVFHKLTGKPREIITHRNNDVNSVLQFIQIYGNKFLSRQTDSLKHHHALIKVMSPENILRKGFAIVSKGDKIITNESDINRGDTITITLEQSNIESTVTSKTQRHGKYDV